MQNVEKFAKNMTIRLFLIRNRYRAQRDTCQDSDPYFRLDPGPYPYLITKKEVHVVTEKARDRERESRETEERETERERETEGGDRQRER